MIVDQNYIQETLGIIFYLKLIYMKQIGEINWSPIPTPRLTVTHLSHQSIEPYEIKGDSLSSVSY